MVLDNKYNWDELARYCCNKIRRGFKDKKEEKEFVDWFMGREKVGWVMDHFAVFKAFKIWKELVDDWDHFTVITGREGSGKSTFAMQNASWVCPNFTLANLKDTSADYQEALEKRNEDIIRRKAEGLPPPEPMAIVFDEGNELLSRESMKRHNIALQKTFIVQRRLHVFVIICVPNFFFLDPTVRQHRVRSLYHLYQRGRYKYFSEPATKIVADAAAKHKDVLKIKLKEEMFQYGDYRKALPYHLDWGEYDDWKLSRNRELLKNGKTQKGSRGGK